jgi:hypothetical protein
MNELNKLSNSFGDTLKDADLQSVTTDLAETFSDTLLSEGLLKDIPIIGTIIGLAKTTLNLKDRLLIKKLVYFISELRDIDSKKRRELISEIDNSEKEKIKIGEKLLYIVDRAEDHIIAKYIAILFKAFLKEEITYQEFLRGSTIIQKLILQDIEQFINTKVSDIERDITQYENGLTDFDNSLINAGICIIDTGPIAIRDQDDYNMSDKYVVEGGERITYLTDIGYTLKKILIKKI